MNGCTPDGDAGALRYYQYFCATELASTFIIINRMLTLYQSALRNCQQLVMF